MESAETPLTQTLLPPHYVEAHSEEALAVNYKSFEIKKDGPDHRLLNFIHCRVRITYKNWETNAVFIEGAVIVFADVDTMNAVQAIYGFTSLCKPLSQIFGCAEHKLVITHVEELEWFKMESLEECVIEDYVHPRAIAILSRKKVLIQILEDAEFG